MISSRWMDTILVMSLIRSIESWKGLPVFPRSQLFQKAPSSQHFVRYKHRPLSGFTLISPAMSEATMTLKQQLLFGENPFCLVFECVIFVLTDYFYCCQGQRSQVTYDPSLSLLHQPGYLVWKYNLGILQMIIPSHETKIDSASYVNNGNKEPVVRRYSFQSEKLQAGVKDCDPFLHRTDISNLSNSLCKHYKGKNAGKTSQDDLFINILPWISVFLIVINIPVQKQAHQANWWNGSDLFCTDLPPL